MQIHGPLTCLRLPPGQTERMRFDEGLASKPLPSGHSWLLRSMSSARWDRYLHGHECWELLLLESGFCKYHIAGFDGSTHSPTAFLFAPGVEHTLYTEGFLPDGQRLSALALWLSPALMEQLASLPEGRFLEPLMARAHQGIQFTNWYADQAARLLRSAEMQPATLQLGAVFQAFHQLAEGRHWQLGTRAKRPQHDPQALALINRLDDWLHAHFDLDVHLPEAAAACAVSISTLNAVLKRHCGCTFLDYLNRMRVDHARSLLEHGSSITEAAFASGFQSLATFNRRFRQQLGKNPGTWLDERRNDAPVPA